jgi:hypothetical protein
MQKIIEAKDSLINLAIKLAVNYLKKFKDKEVSGEKDG